VKPYGRTKKRQINYPDNHLGKGVLNWWEDEGPQPIKKTERREAKEKIGEEL